MEQVQSKLYGEDLFGEAITRPATGVLAKNFLFPPFSVFNTRAGEWQERKRAWLSIGIRSEIGRDAKAMNIGFKARPENNWTIEDDQGSGTSVFDPVLTECVYRWFAAPGWQIVDPFAGGSVRGIVAGVLGRKYWGADLRAEQIAANDDQADAIVGPRWYGPGELTPVEQIDGVWIKRDDRFGIAGVVGGKVRTCWSLAQKATTGLTTAGSRSSPQALIVASIARKLGIACVVHTPEGDITTGPVAGAARQGAKITQHPAGYNTVIVARCREFAAESGFTEIPFGMECEEAVTQTRAQVANIPDGVRRIVVPVGSGMTLAGILWGLKDAGRTIPVLGISVGADPTDRLNKYAPPDWPSMVELMPTRYKYADHIESFLGPISLDPVYEAKCREFLQPGDLFWIVGHREPYTDEGYIRPRWVVGDSMEVLDDAPDADLVFSCPPYGDLEKYSDDPADLSTMEWHTFVAAYKRIILRAASRLKPNRFACFVVGDFRDDRGHYRDFVSTTIAAFKECGLELYNEAILTSPVGSGALRATKQFDTSRKMIKVHQNILVFLKGDARRAASEINAIDKTEDAK
jgi:hypothetical protein